MMNRKLYHSLNRSISKYRFIDKMITNKGTEEFKQMDILKNEILVICTLIRREIFSYKSSLTIDALFFEEVSFPYPWQNPYEYFDLKYFTVA